MNTNEVEYDGLFYKIDSEAKTATLSRSNGSNPVFRQAQVLFDFKIPSVMYYNDEQYTITCHCRKCISLIINAIYFVISLYKILRRFRRGCRGW